MYPMSHLLPTLFPTLSPVPQSMPQLRLQTEPLIYLGSKAQPPVSSPINYSQVPTLWTITSDKGWGQVGRSRHSKKDWTANTGNG